MRSTRTGHRWAAMMVAPTLMMLAAVIAAPAQTYKVLYSFTGTADGAFPIAALVLDSQGNLYGTAQRGGSNRDGVVFELDTARKESVLHNFLGTPTDGAFPAAGLSRDSAGNLYGTTGSGGEIAFGTAFALTASGNETLLHDFTSSVQGRTPQGGLLQVGNDFYGTTYSGGGTCTCGVVFKISSNGAETVLHDFAGSPTDGAHPSSGTLVADSAGNVYGSTSGGGAYGFGAIFEVSAAGTETLLYSFKGQPDGAYPMGVVLDGSGNLYGATYSGGTLGFGSVFEIDPGKQETVLYSFAGNARGFEDGMYPDAGVIQDQAGNLYGTTYAGGIGAGTVFKLDTSGIETILYSFVNKADGKSPHGGLVMDSAGNLYGTTQYGGAWGAGVVFEVVP